VAIIRPARCGGASDAAFVEWRYLDNPMLEQQVVVVEDAAPL